MVPGTWICITNNDVTDTFPIRVLSEDLHEDFGLSEIVEERTKGESLIFFFFTFLIYWQFFYFLKEPEINYFE